MTNPQNASFACKNASFKLSTALYTSQSKMTQDEYTIARNKVDEFNYKIWYFKNNAKALLSLGNEIVKVTRIILDSYM